MDSVYEPYWQQAMQLRHQTQDMIADHSHPMARSLHTETVRLVDDIELNRAPRAIEDRIYAIQHQLLEARSQGDKVISVPHNTGLHHEYERMRESIRQLPHY